MKSCWPSQMHTTCAILAPVEETQFGLPVENGDVGAMVWTPADRLQVTVNKSNAWDDMSAVPVLEWHGSAQTKERVTGWRCVRRSRLRTR